MTSYDDCIRYTVHGEPTGVSHEAHMDGCRSGSRKCGFEKPPAVIAADIAAHAAFWCRCETPSDDVTYHEDGEHANGTATHTPCYKHHYDCTVCGKVVQTD